MVEQKDLAQMLDLKDVTVRHVLKGKRSRGIKKIPERFLGKNAKGEVRTQEEAQVVRAKVWEVQDFLDNQELRLKAEKKAAEASGLAKTLRLELIKAIIRTRQVKRFLQGARFDVIKGCAQKRARPVVPALLHSFLLNKADGEVYMDASAEA